jgi:hypothetical protein
VASNIQATVAKHGCIKMAINQIMQLFPPIFDGYQCEFKREGRKVCKMARQPFRKIRPVARDPIYGQADEKKELARNL